MNLTKRLEYAAKKIFVLILKLFIRLPKIDRVDPATIKSILFLRHDWLGDVIISTPVFRLVKQRYPAMQIHVLTTPAGGRLLEHDPHITLLHCFNKKKPLSVVSLIRKLRAIRYDAVVNLVYRTSFTGSMLAYLCAPKNALRIRLTGDDDKNFFYNMNISKKIFGAATKTMVEETAELVAVFNIEPGSADLRPRIYLSPKSQENAGLFFAQQNLARPIKVGMNLSAREEYREWSVDNVSKFADLLCKDNQSIAIYIFGSPQSQKYAQLKSEVKNPAVIFIPQNPDILEIAAILERMHMLISPDTAMVHLATALNIPTLGLYYNNEKAVLWRPFGVAGRTIVALSGKIAEIGVEEVLRQTKSLLKDTGHL